MELEIGLEDSLPESAWDEEPADLYDDPNASLGEESTVALFPGDDGQLSLAQRQCLLAIQKHRYISRTTHRQEWDTLLGNRLLIKSRLNDVFLDLVIDEPGEVAFKRQAVPEGGIRRFPTLLHDVPYSMEETILLVHVRQRFRAEGSGADGVVLVDRDALVEHVQGFRPVHATDQSGDQRRAENAIDSLLKMRILLRTTDANRLRIAPVVATLLPLSRLQDLLEEIQIRNGTIGGADPGDDVADNLPPDEGIGS